MEYIYKKPLMHSKGVYVHARIHTYTHTHTHSLSYIWTVFRDTISAFEKTVLLKQKREVSK